MNENKKAKKVVALLLCAVLLVVGSVSATVAYLTDSKSVTNTFSVGNVAITLDEALVDEYGKPMRVENGSKVYVNSVEDADRVDTNEYKLIPGHTYKKDPVIHVASGSEECYLFVKVENGLDAIEADGDTEIIAQMIKNNTWQAVDANVYAYKTTVDARDEAVNVPTFETFKIANDKDVSGYATATNNTAIIKVTAYAVQADGFATANEAWTATFGESTNP